MTCGYLYKNECYNEAPWLLFECVWVIWGGGAGCGRGGLGQGGMREDSAIRVLVKVPLPPTWESCPFACGWMDGSIGRWSFSFSATQEYLFYLIQTRQKDSKTEFPIYLPTHAQPRSFPEVTLQSFGLCSSGLFLCVHLRFMYTHSSVRKDTQLFF